MDDPEAPPRTVFSLSEWRERVETSESEPSELPGSTGAVLQALQVLANERLDFVDFDAAGTLYLGAFDDGVVLEFQLPRSSGRYAVGLSAGIVDGTPGIEGELRMHAWQKSALVRR